MSSVCSTCKFNGGCLDEVRKIFKNTYTGGFPSNTIICKNEAAGPLTFPKEKCDHWEVCNNGL